MDIATQEATAQLQTKSASTATILDTLQLYVESPKTPGTRGEERVTPGQGHPVARDAAVTL